MSSSMAEGKRVAASEGWQALFRLFSEGDGQRRFHEACDATGLAPGALKALLQLSSGEPRSMREMADTFRCDPSYVTSLVDALEGAGLAERRLHPTDRRVKVVALTELGVQRESEVQKILAQPPDSFDVLSVDELRQLRDVLVRLLEASKLQ